jgi:hypothetical protein
MRPYAERHGLTMLQLACLWNLAQPAVRCVAPTLIQEIGSPADPAHPRPVEDKRAELAAVAGLGPVISPEEIAELRKIGDNTGSMALKGGSDAYHGEQRADRWELDGQLAAVAARWQIDPRHDLAERVPVTANDD